MELMEAEKIILTLGEYLGYVYGTVALRIYLSDRGAEMSCMCKSVPLIVCFMFGLVWMM